MTSREGEKRSHTIVGNLFLGLIGIKDIDFVGRSEAETPLKQER
jgi:hypothetical protein